ncbi:rhodanese-like domain-containing protein [Solwaraspora sp. WMMD406]|uniref:rhodanese-like domain-containing protein n=1 Tax=Solwaraspora sp. WMMD406 TaxID=3016095 RepID=UPI002415FB06|nr:rhodanese-like domain-containing protein [Solwaraspora sp. WMMD406]MDG4763137.1 rhodanese-like domain-containing protein [Solwaraspora sp. WMMD406]
MYGPPIPTVEATDVGDDAYLLDVREPDEWVAGHAPGAHHLPMMEVPARLAEIPQDGDVVVVCRSGGRSGQVVAYLTQHGWDNVRNLAGGMQDWAASGRPMTSETGAPPLVR